MQVQDRIQSKSKLFNFFMLEIPRDGILEINAKQQNLEVAISVPVILLFACFFILGSQPLFPTGF